MNLRVQLEEAMNDRVLELSGEARTKSIAAHSVALKLLEIHKQWINKLELEEEKVFLYYNLTVELPDKSITKPVFIEVHRETGKARIFFYRTKSDGTESSAKTTFLPHWIDLKDTDVLKGFREVYDTIC